MDKIRLFFILSLSFLAACAPAPRRAPVSGQMTAERIYSGFADAHDTYNAISPASDGRIYYVLSSQRHDVGGQFYRYDPATGTPEFIADLSEALGIGSGDEVITSPYTDMGTIVSILSARALPVLADIDRYSFQIDPADVERKITRHTKAIMPIHIMGQACEMDKIMDKMESLLNKTDQR